MNRLTMLAAGAAAAFASTQASAITYVAGASGSFTTQYAGIYALTAAGGAGGLGRAFTGTRTYAGGNGYALTSRTVLNVGTVLNAFSGGRGGDGGTGSGGGGGGASYILDSTGQILLVGSGGGGGGYSSSAPTTTGSGVSGSGTDGGTAGGSRNTVDGLVYGGGGGGGLTGAGIGNGVARGGLAGSGAAAQTAISGRGGAGGTGGGGSGGNGGGGGGGYAGGGGGGPTGAGRNGSSYLKAGLNAQSLADSSGGDGYVTIEATRYFARPVFSDTTIDFGVVRGGTSVTRSITVTNMGPADALTDRLIVNPGGRPNGSGAFQLAQTPTAITGGQSSDNLKYSFSGSGYPGGVYTSTAMPSLASVGGEDQVSGTLATVGLGSASITLKATLTALATASFSAQGYGSFSGSNGTYFLNFGDVVAGSGTLSAVFNVTNGAAVSPYSESLGGSYTGALGTGFGYAPGSFADLAGGKSAFLGPVTFDSTGLSAGVYSTAIDYALFSRYAGLADASLSAQRIIVRANVLAPVAPPAAEPVPEPATWGTMLVGFGLTGAAMRRRRRAVIAAGRSRATWCGGARVALRFSTPR